MVINDDIREWLKNHASEFEDAAALAVACNKHFNDGDNPPDELAELAEEIFNNDDDDDDDNDDDPETKTASADPPR